MIDTYLNYFNIGDVVSSSKATGKRGRIVELNLETRRARIFWGERRTWVAFEYLIKREEGEAIG